MSYKKFFLVLLAVVAVWALAFFASGCSNAQALAGSSIDPGVSTPISVYSQTSTVTCATLQGLAAGVKTYSVDMSAPLASGARLFAYNVVITDAFTSSGSFDVLTYLVKSSDAALTWNTTLQSTGGGTQTTVCGVLDFRDWGGKTLRLTTGLVKAFPYNELDLNTCLSGSLTITAFYALAL